MPDPGLVKERRQFTARIRALETQHAALLVALEALITNWQQREQQYRHVRPHDAATPDTLRNCASELAHVLRPHRETP